MSVLRGILELQGCLDTAVVRTQDVRVAEIANAFLPGSPANQGWYQELEAFMVPGDPHVDANPDTALRTIAETAEGQRLSAPQASRLMYALGAVIHLVRNFPEGVELPFPDPTLPTEESRLVDVLVLMTPATLSGDPREIVEARLEQAIALFSTQFHSWEDWHHVANILAGEDFQFLTEDAASVPLCLPSVVTIRGRTAVVVDTEFTSEKLSLNQVKEVVDPRNWDNNYPAFFCDMTYKGKRKDNWRRVLETVGFCPIPEPIGLRLRTMLKFYKYTVNGPDVYEARLDYDLNDPVPDPWGDGKITIDCGYINMVALPYGDPKYPNGNPHHAPVKVVTRKVARIEGVSPYAQARLVCASGYAYAAMEMIFGNADHPDSIPDRSPWLDPDENPSDPGLPGHHQHRPHPDNSAASTAITMAVQCVQEMSAKQFAISDKWMAGQLTVSDLTQYSSEVGARILSEPWRIMEAIAKSKGTGQ